MVKNNWELGCKVNYYNGTLRKLRLEKGLTQKELGEAVGVSTHSIWLYESMKGAPEKEVAEKLAKFFGVEVPKVFPEYLKMLSERIPKSEIVYGELSDNALEQISQQHLLLADTSSSPEMEMKKKELLSILGESLNTLSDREQKILKMRFGIGGEDRHTLEEVGAWFGTSGSNISRIEQNALRKLRRRLNDKKIRNYEDICI